SWKVSWPFICDILYELDYLFHGAEPPCIEPFLGSNLIQWLTPHFPSSTNV
ncbi:hypothetical protein BDF20DRAFT_812267, partial [Mycotypha africana]|uniref:uncharacterized protein n=1 Tax=Mycotypha africana TaxID=64632 RepID=UPI0022FFEC4E